MAFPVKKTGINAIFGLVMGKFLAFIRRMLRFFSYDLWHIRAGRLDKKQGFLIIQLRIMTLAIKGFTEDKCVVKASALTFYIMFALVPVLALLFAIAQGFGLKQKLEKDLLTDLSQYRNILEQAFDFANKMLTTAGGGIIAVVGIILIVYTVLKLLSSIEDSFNDIWQIKKGRTLIRRITDYIAITLFAPVLILVSSSITIFLRGEVGAVESLSWFHKLDFVAKLFLKLFSLLMMGGLFTFIYMTLPNTKVKFKAAFIAGIIAAVAFEILQWAYIGFQIGAARYNAVYGSFAALPLFLVWIQYNWFIVLFGAELAFAYQNVDHYELESEIKNISPRYKRVISLLIANLVVKNFTAGNKALTATQIAAKLDMPVRLARIVVTDFTDTGIFTEVKTQNEKEIAYQPGISESELSVKYILDKIDTRGVNEMPIHSTHELETIHRVMDDFDEVVKKNKGNVLVKDIL
ncbi:MAG TPA: YihY/virulence factor BrkB family protein [Bacteroidia bacterium]|jgi:membrane protein|nr:YihY/virulence factor BrkB family protein [Bacteroidia bacterium]